MRGWSRLPASPNVPRVYGFGRPSLAASTGRRLIRHALDGDPRPLLWLGVPVIVALAVLAGLDVGGQAILWENGHWTLAGLLAAVIAALAARAATGQDRRLRALIAIGCAAWFIGQVVWDLQTMVGYYSLPAPSDLGYMFLAVPVLGAFLVYVHGRLPRVEEVAVYLDATAIFLAISGLILAAYGAQVAHLALLGAAVTVAYPIVHLATAGAGLVILVATGARPRLGGGYLGLLGFAILGGAWVGWLKDAAVAQPAAGSLINDLFSLGILCVAVGGATVRVEAPSVGRVRSRAAIALGGLPLLALAVSAVLIATKEQDVSMPGLIEAAAVAIIVLTGLRQWLLVHERGRLLDAANRAQEDLQDALARRAEADTRYRVLVEHVPAAVYIDSEDPRVTDGGRLLYLSPQIEAILGYPPEAFINDPELWPSLIHPEDRAIALNAYSEHWSGGDLLRAEYRMYTRDGSLVWLRDEAYAMNEGTDKGRVSQGLLIDTTDHKRLEAQLLHDALHDPLTGLANRVLFREHLERALLRRRRRGSHVAVLFLDLDDFKVVNDSLGHRAGDRLLIEVAHRLSGAIRAGDIAARQGGDEFTVLLESVKGAADAVQSAERLAIELRRPIELDGRSLVVGVSVGIALSSGHDTGADDLLAHADAAMYAAKADGKARHAVFDPTMRARARSRLETEAELRRAIEAAAFELAYQPIIDLTTTQIVGFEALVRWRHPERGLIPPSDFIPLAEATGLIVQLGRLVTETACRQLRAWRDAFPTAPITMSVNVSPRQAGEPGFAAETRAILSATGIEPSSLVMEITESIMLRESSETDGTLRQLGELGVRLAVDDFGTGFSALEYFKRFAIESLKIDRSFIAGLGSSRTDTAIVTATLAFASALDLSVTAEGVETEAQLDRLRALGCQRGQGYLFARPMAADDATAFLARTTGSAGAGAAGASAAGAADPPAVPAPSTTRAA
jgi:diguanylate cyclase (GGDEF)-like protein/PAS domain S-box-containing protein